MTDPTTAPQERHELFGIVFPACATCARRQGPTTCSAFPAGIPHAILRGDDAHRTPVDGDGGLTYAARPDAAASAGKFAGNGAQGPFFPTPPFTRAPGGFSAQ